MANQHALVEQGAWDACIASVAVILVNAGKILELHGEGRLECALPAGPVAPAAVPEVPVPERPVLMPPRGNWLSRIEEDVLRLLAERCDWMVTKDIAEALHEAPSGRLRTILANLVERDILEGGDARGYRLPPAKPNGAG
jgi:hypothetical protein